MKYGLVIYDVDIRQVVKVIKGFSLYFDNIDTDEVLLDIDSFTKQFSCEEDLVQYLKERKLINNDDIDRNYSIKIAKKDSQGYQISQFNSEVLYSDFTFFDNKKELISYYQEKIVDSVFLSSFLKSFSDLLYNQYFTEITSLNRFLSLSDRNPEYLKKYIIQFINKYIQKKNSNELSYSGLRRLTIFAREYQKNELDILLDNNPSVSEMKSEIKYYQELLKNPYLGYEACISYHTKIKELEKEIENVRDNIRLERGLYDGTSRH